MSLKARLEALESELVPDSSSQAFDKWLDALMDAAYSDDPKHRERPLPDAGNDPHVAALLERIEKAYA